DYRQGAPRSGHAQDEGGFTRGPGHHGCATRLAGQGETLKSLDPAGGADYLKGSVDRLPAELIERGFEASRQFARWSRPPIVKEEDRRLRGRHVLMNGDNL